jgi:hypothetical protein
METTYNFDPTSLAKGNNISKSESSKDSDKLNSSDDSNSKQQTTGNSTSKEDGYDSNNDSDTEAVRKLLLANPKLFKQLLSKESKKAKPKGQSHKKKCITPAEVTPINNNKVKLAGSRSTGSAGLPKKGTGSSR